jgi:hypothetical protein
VPRRRSTADLLRCAARWALVIALALGPVGLGAALDTLSPAAGSDSCDCDAIHAAHAAADANAADDDCAGECPPGCPDCACCPGLAPGLRAALRVDPSLSGSGPAPQLTADSPAIGDSPDFFRPPRRLA